MSSNISITNNMNNSTPKCPVCYQNCQSCRDNENTDEFQHLFETQWTKLASNLVDKYPSVFASNIVFSILEDISQYSFIIQLSRFIWELNPHPVITLADLLDISLLIQLSYEAFLVFLNMPDMCNYDHMDNFNLYQVQLTLIWITSFISEEIVVLFQKLEPKMKSKTDKLLWIALGKHCQQHLIKHDWFSDAVSSLDEDLVPRRQQLFNLITNWDNVFYKHLILFMMSLFVTKQPPPPSREINGLISQTIASVYLEIHPAKKKKKRRPFSTTSKTKDPLMASDMANIKVATQLFKEYKDAKEEYLREKGNGIPFM